MNLLRKLWRGERGQSMVEYALLAALIGVVLILVIGRLTTGIEGVFDSVVAALAPVAP